jgi:hypothetical protein
VVEYNDETAHDQSHLTWSRKIADIVMMMMMTSLHHPLVPPLTAHVMTLTMTIMMSNRRRQSIGMVVVFTIHSFNFKRKVVAVGSGLFYPASVPCV